MKTRSTIPILMMLILFQNNIQAQKLRNKISKSIVAIETSFTSIQQDRKLLLDGLASRIFKANKNDAHTSVVFIDKANKEKSQLATIWLKTGLLHYGFNDYAILSAGTEIVKEPFPALTALEKYGFRVGNAIGKERYSYFVNSGSEIWAVRYTNYETLRLNDDEVLKIYVEEQIRPEDGSKKIEVPLSSPESIAQEMLYVASRIKYLSDNQ